MCAVVGVFVVVGVCAVVVDDGVDGVVVFGVVVVDDVAGVVGTAVVVSV